MRKIYLILSAILLTLPCHAQEMAVAPDAELYISAGTDLYLSGLTLTPSAGFTMSDRSILRDTAVTHTFGNAYVQRTYAFSDTTLFSGAIRINYLEGELDGLNESSLQVGVYNGSAWQTAGAATVSSADNYVSVSGITGLPLGELILADGIALPLTWGDISATGQGQLVVVKWYTMQERNIAHFDLQRSSDGIGWTTVIAGIPARNQATRADYEQTDKPGYYGRIYYRIKQTDADGRFSFSRAVAVVMENDGGLVVLSPNPAGTYFNISGIPAATIQQVDLLHATGRLVRSWKGNQHHFSVSGLSAGVYYLKIRTTAGGLVRLPLSVR